MQPPSPQQILEVGLGFWASQTLLSAVGMGLFTELAREPGDLKSLQQRLKLHPRGAADFLDALVALGFLERTDGVYRNTPSTEVFLDRAKPSYIGGMLEMAQQRLYPYWGRLTDALQTGERQNETRDGSPDLFSALYSDPQRLKQFLRAMSGISRGANCEIARRLPWGQYRTYVDIGTAQGDLAVQIALANPHLRGQGFDLPQVSTIFGEYVAELGLTERVTFQPGDFFRDELPAADVMLMGHILHDWGLDDKRMLIAKAYRALPPGGALVVYDALIDDDRRQNAFGLLMSLNMLIETPAGFDYTGADCQGWMQDAGFRETRVLHLIGPDAMVVGIK